MADRHFYLRRAYEKAFGQFDEASWDPEAGFKANEARILKLYDYYRDTYLARPDLFLWAGLGRMAGGAVIGGFRLLMTPGLFGLSTETFLTRTLVRIGKAIFHDLAWQHEAILDNPVEALALIAQHDLVSSARTSYALAWTHILSGNEVILPMETACCWRMSSSQSSNPNMIESWRVRKQGCSGSQVIY
jgi:hypothetical protein